MPDNELSVPLTLISGPRRRILALLRARDRTIPDLARELAITTNAVRGHLTVLGRDGLVVGGAARRTDQRGKPATLYGLTAAGEELFPRGYGALLFGVMDLLTDWDGPDAPTEVMRAAGARGADGEGPEAAARALVRMGADAHLDAADGEAVVRANGCPLAAAVLERPELCRWMSALLAGACGRAVTASCDHSGGRPRCRFTIERADPAAS